MSPIAQPVRQCENDRRALILQTALKLFTEGGYFNTSVHDIQKEAKVSIGSIYHYFKNKEAIAKALYDDLIDRMARNMEEIRDAHASTHDRCRAVVACFFDLTETSPDTMKYILYARHREFMPDEKPICSSRPFEMMKHMVEEGIGKGEICEMSPTVAATSIFGGAIRLVQLRLDGVLDEPVSDYIDQTWQCAWKGVAR